MFDDIDAFIRELDRRRELARIAEPVSPDLEIAAVTDRASKAPGGGPALLFERPAGHAISVAANLFGSMSRVCLALGWCFKRIGNIEEAIRALERALRVEPGDAMLHYNLACYFSLARRRRRALDHLAQALEIDGNFRDLVGDESDFDPLRDDPQFQSLVSAAG